MNPIRYTRQTSIPHIGITGQNILANAIVLIAGAGGLGSISSYYLAAAGIGKLIVVDNDTVDFSNLNRQIVHSEADIGKAKAFSAAQSLEQLNSSIQIHAVNAEITDTSILPLLEQVDVIVDACDNIKTRHVLNRASLKKAIPYVFGGVDGFSGMASTFVPGETPCFKCVFPNENRLETKPGIIGPIAGIIGSLQAMEVIKLLLNIGKTMSHHLFRISGLDMRITHTLVERDLGCPACCGSFIKKTESI